MPPDDPANRATLSLGPIPVFALGLAAAAKLAAAKLAGPRARQRQKVITWPSSARKCSLSPFA